MIHHFFLQNHIWRMMLPSLVCRDIYWQEVPIHWQSFNQRSYSFWHLPQCEDGEDHNCSKGLPSLCQEISEARTQLICFSFSSFNFSFFICSVIGSDIMYMNMNIMLIGFVTFYTFSISICKFSHPSFWCCFSGMRRGTRTFQPIFPHASVWKKAIMLPLANAGLYY